MWIVNNNHQRKKIAIALKNDIEEFDERISRLANRDVITQAHSFGGDNSPFILPFFEKENFYYNSIKTEISLFENPLADVINDYYKLLISVEHYRKMTVQGEGLRIEREFYNSLISLHERAIKEIIPKLDVEIQWSILLPHGTLPRSKIGHIACNLGKVTVAFCVILLVAIGISVFISNDTYSDQATSNYDGSMDAYYENNEDHIYNESMYISRPTEPTPKPELRLSLGQSVTTENDLQITIFSAKRIKSYSYYSNYVDPPVYRIVNSSKGKEFLIFDMETKNIGSTEGREYPNVNLFARDSNSNSYQYDFNDNYAAEDQYHAKTVLIPNEHIRGILAFTIPETAKDLSICYKLGGYPNQNACWDIPN